jgi:HK97 family phage prohead protease
MNIRSELAAGKTPLDERTVIGIASDGTPDRDGDILLPQGCVIDEYLANNIVVVGHDTSKPVGNADLKVSPEAVTAGIRFAPPGLSKLAGQWRGPVKVGIIKALSVGFLPIEKEPRKGGGWLFRKWRLLELSVVAVPSNPKALIYQRGLKSAVASHRKACGFIIAKPDMPLSRAARLGISAALAPPGGAERLCRAAALDATRVPLSHAERMRIAAALRR